MNSLISRRAFLAASAASTGMPGFLISAPAAAAIESTRLLAERRTVEVDGRAASVFSIRQPNGTPGMVLCPGQPFLVSVENRAAEATIVHWHGRAPSFLQDGIVETGGLLIQPGAVQAYDFPARPWKTPWRRSLRLPPGSGAMTHRITLTGSMMPYVWSLDDRTWANHVPLHASKEQRVVVKMSNRIRMTHPMRLHGHHFQVVVLEETALSGAMRDTVLMPASGSVTVALDADNPGRWLCQCHDLFHMATGMMTELAYESIA